jgi:hypothetical protein
VAREREEAIIIIQERKRDFAGFVRRMDGSLLLDGRRRNDDDGKSASLSFVCMYVWWMKE